MKTFYRATFSNGMILTRGTERTYAHARVIFNDKDEVYASGFSGSLHLAEKAANQCLPTDHEAAFKKKNKYRSEYSRRETLRWLKEYHEEARAAQLAKLRVEIVELTPPDPYGRNHTELAHDAAGTQY